MTRNSIESSFIDNSELPTRSLRNLSRVETPYQTPISESSVRNSRRDVSASSQQEVSTTPLLPSKSNRSNLGVRRGSTQNNLSPPPQTILPISSISKDASAHNSAASTTPSLPILPPIQQTSNNSSSNFSIHSPLQVSTSSQSTPPTHSLETTTLTKTSLITLPTVDNSNPITSQEVEVVHMEKLDTVSTSGNKKFVLLGYILFWLVVLFADKSSLPFNDIAKAFLSDWKPNIYHSSNDVIEEKLSFVEGELESASLEDIAVEERSEALITLSNEIPSSIEGVESSSHLPTSPIPLSNSEEQNGTSTIEPVIASSSFSFLQLTSYLSYLNSWFTSMYSALLNTNIRNPPSDIFDKVLLSEKILEEQLNSLDHFALKQSRLASLHDGAEKVIADLTLQKQQQELEFEEYRLKQQQQQQQLRDESDGGVDGVGEVDETKAEIRQLTPSEIILQEITSQYNQRRKSMLENMDSITKNIDVESDEITEILLKKYHQEEGRSGKDAGTGGMGEGGGDVDVASESLPSELRVSEGMTDGEEEVLRIRSSLHHLVGVVNMLSSKNPKQKKTSPEAGVSDSSSVSNGPKKSIVQSAAIESQKASLTAVEEAIKESATKLNDLTKLLGQKYGDSSFHSNPLFSLSKHSQAVRTSVDSNENDSTNDIKSSIPATQSIESVVKEILNVKVVTEEILQEVREERDQKILDLSEDIVQSVGVNLLVEENDADLLPSTILNLDELKAQITSEVIQKIDAEVEVVEVKASHLNEEKREAFEQKNADISATAEADLAARPTVAVDGNKLTVEDVTDVIKNEIADLENGKQYELSKFNSHKEMLEEEKRELVMMDQKHLERMKQEKEHYQEEQKEMRTVSGLMDYASTVRGGRILNHQTPFSNGILTSLPYLPSKDAVSNVLYATKLVTQSSDPLVVLSQTIPPAPGHCYAFSGNKGNMTIVLQKPIQISKFRLYQLLEESEMHSNAHGSTPKDFSVIGWTKHPKPKSGPLGVKFFDAGKAYPLGDFTYDASVGSKPLQDFEVKLDKLKGFDVNSIEELPAFQAITFVFLSNYGHTDYTCVYRTMVIGKMG